jgi:predicted O-methyltransferase YrrM
VSLEHDEKYAAVTRAALVRQHLDRFVDLRIAALAPVTIDETEYRWYSEKALSGVTNIHLVFVDGPPGATGARARFPALPLLAPALADGAVIVLDDTDRSDEKAIVEQWCDRPWAGGMARVDRLLDHATALRFVASAS